MVSQLDLSLSALLTDLAMCVNYYRLFTPGLYCCVLPPVQLSENTHIRPGVMAMVNYGQHKQCDPGEDYLCFQGPPNFVMDVFREDLADYDDRRLLFENAGVQEYVAVRHTEPLTWIWNRLQDGRYATVKAGDDDLIASSALPGFWMPVAAFRKRDWWTVMSTIARGVTRKEHHVFMETIWHA